jgi:MFS family permease
MTELGTETITDIDLASVRKRTRWVLIGSVFPAGMGMTATFAATSLAAKEITANDGLASLAATMTAIGGAIAAVPLGRYMNEHGRRAGLTRAWLIGATGAAIAFAGVLGSSTSCSSSVASVLVWARRPALRPAIPPPTSPRKTAKRARSGS